MNMLIETLDVCDNKSGKLIPIELNKVPFIPLRFFWITGMKQGVISGQHAHYLTKQYIICIQGKVEIDLYDGIVHRKFILNPNESIFVDKLIWDSQKYLTNNDILLVLCSTLYNKEDYIYNIIDFENQQRGRK